ncbi:MAG: transposase [Deltaproteobacteria bacterium]|nr:transposase [Deltaproteobacteria bacterium]MBW2397108.1 transposase [Deltaproteobacteria bacterium]
MRADRDAAVDVPVPHSGLGRWPGARAASGARERATSFWLPASAHLAEFTSRALDEWVYRRSARLQFIEPAKPVQNYFIESFNGKFRKECLNDLTPREFALRAKAA